MAIYSLSQRTTNTTIANPCWEIRSAAGNKPKVLEIGISINAATASVYGLGRPAAIGVTPTSPQTFVDESDGGSGATAAPTGNTTAAVAWGTPPTVPANFLRRVSTPATIGAGVIWTFPRGLGIPNQSGTVGSLVIWNITATSAADVWAVVDE